MGKWGEEERSVASVISVDVSVESMMSVGAVVEGSNTDRSQGVR